MTATAEPRNSPPAVQAELGTLDQLLSRGKPQKTKDVELAGVGRYRVRELSQGEVEDIRFEILQQTTDEAGKVSGRIDSRGYKAKVVACALVKADGSQCFSHPLSEYKALNSLTQRNMYALFEAVDELTGLSKEEKDALGKESGAAASSTGQ